MNGFEPPPIRHGLGIGWLGGLVLVFVGVCAYFIVADALFAPWIYTVGAGRLLPLWQGVGEIHAHSGTFTVYVSFSPSSAASTLVPAAGLSGSGSLGTPTGERLTFRLSGRTSGKSYREMKWQIRGTRANHFRPNLRFSG